MAMANVIGIMTIVDNRNLIRLNGVWLLYLAVGTHNERAGYWSLSSPALSVLFTGFNVSVFKLQSLISKYVNQCSFYV